MKVKVKFANKDVNIKKLVQGATVMEVLDNGEYDIFHIHRFGFFNCADNTANIVVANDWGKCTKNSVELTWPI